MFSQSLSTTLQKKALTIIYGAYKSLSIAVLELKCGILHLRLHMYENQLKVAVKIKTLHRKNPKIPIQDHRINYVQCNKNRDLLLIIKQKHSFKKIYQNLKTL